MSKKTYKIYKEFKDEIKRNLQTDKNKMISYQDLNTLMEEIETKHRINPKLRILVDMDGVMAQDLKYAIKLYNEEYSADITMRDLKGWDIDNYVPEGTSILKYFYQPGFFNKLEPMPNSRRILKKLFDEGHEIIIATASPDVGVYDKISFLKQYYPWLPEENFVSIKKKYLLHADVILDDAAHNLESASVTYPIMFYAYHNKDNHDFIKVYDWKEFYNFIQKIVENKIKNNKKVFI